MNTDWQPIESAPKDGTEILATNGTDYFICRWYYVTGAYYSPNPRHGWATTYDNEFMKYDEENPSHWMPLPKLPTP